MKGSIYLYVIVISFFSNACKSVKKIAVPDEFAAETYKYQLTYLDSFAFRHLYDLDSQMLSDTFPEYRLIHRDSLSFKIYKDSSMDIEYHHHGITHHYRTIRFLRKNIWEFDRDGNLVYVYNYGWSRHLEFRNEFGIVKLAKFYLVCPDF